MIDVPCGKYIGRPVGDPPKSKAEHFIKCPPWGGWIARCNLGQVIDHFGPLPHSGSRKAGINFNCARPKLGDSPTRRGVWATGRDLLSALLRGHPATNQSGRNPRFCPQSMGRSLRPVLSLAGERMISNSGMGWPASRQPETVSKMIFTEAEGI